MDDGTPGILTSDSNDPDGPLVCMPIDEDKSAKETDGREPQKKLLKTIPDEHTHHTGEVDKAIDDFREKAVVEDQGDIEDANKSAKPDRTEVMRECIKDLRASTSDEHTMHRANLVKCLRSFDPNDDNKAFDKNKHLKAVREAHDQYEARNNKALDEFEEKCVKSVHRAVPY